MVRTCQAPCVPDRPTRSPSAAPTSCSLPSQATWAALSALKALRIDALLEGDAAEVVGPLNQLTRLAVYSGGQHMARWPAALSGLSHLQRFSWRSSQDAAGPLPAGPWLTSLRRVALHASVAACSVDALSAAPKLECLGAWELNTAAPAQASMLQRMVALPSMQRLGFCTQHPFCLGQHDLAAALGAALREKPDGFLIMYDDAEGVQQLATGADAWHLGLQ